MITDPPFTTVYIVENLLFLFVTSVPVFSKHLLKYPCAKSSRSYIPLRITMLQVPTPAVTGDSVRLRCGYELGNETLYAVKWYKDMAEFFRYVPASEPPLKTFPQVGIDVDMTKSDGNTVFLRYLSLESSGNFTCQVSTDKPYFRCVQATKPLEVVVPPSDGPKLLGDKNDYELGDNVSLLCNSGKAKPAPELKWYINDQLASSELADQETTVYPDQLESSSLALRFRLQPEVLHNGKVVLKCVATLKHMHAVTIKEIRATGLTAAEPRLWLISCIAFLSIFIQAAHNSHPV